MHPRTPLLTLAVVALTVLCAGTDVLARDRLRDRCETSVVVDRVRFERGLASLAADLDRIAELLPDVRRTTTREALCAALSDARDGVRSLDRRLRHAPPSDFDLTPEPMDDREFRELVRHVRKAAFADEQVALLREVAPHAVFSCDQVARILKDIGPSDGKVDAAFLLHARVTDPRNFAKVYDAIPFSSSRKELRERLARVR